MKRVLPILCICLLTVSLTPLFGCRSSAPALEEVYDQLVEKIEAAVDVNTVAFGVGLPVFARDSAEEALIHRYYGVTDDSSEFVMSNARYTTCDEIEAAIRSVYSTAYADSLCSSLLTGLAFTEGGVVSPARYREENGSLRQSNRITPTVSGTRIFDYASMEIQSDSYRDYLHVTIRSRMDSPGSEWKTSNLYFVIQDGAWYLNGPSC